MLKKDNAFFIFRKISFDIYKHDIHFDEKAFQSGMLKIQFPNDNEKLSVYLKIKSPLKISQLIYLHWKKKPGIFKIL